MGEREMKFELSMIGEDKPYKTFTETTSPRWLNCQDTVPGSTMDNRWFWTDYVLTLEVGQSVETDFSVIKRVE